MNVILVDSKDKEIGIESKLDAHKEGKLHRAFSVFIFNLKGELLLQKRAQDKYHSSGLWSNTCCSHPIEKNIKKEAERRLKEEMGFSCKLEEKFSLMYKAKMKNNLIENEYDHVFFGYYDKEPNPNPEEVSEYKWVSLDKLKKEVEKKPEIFTPWLRIILDELIFWIDK